MPERVAPTRSSNSDHDVANLGIVRPPLVYLAAILLGAGLDFVLPLRWLTPAAAAWIGVPLVVFAVALFVASTRRFRIAGTPVPGNRPTTTIVQSGPYRFSRNPIYLAFSLLVLGLACWLNSLWLLGTLAVALTLMNVVVIPREERYLERRFAAEYREYKSRVRRWV